MVCRFFIQLILLGSLCSTANAVRVFELEGHGTTPLSGGNSGHVAGFSIDRGDLLLRLDETTGEISITGSSRFCVAIRSCNPDGADSQFRASYGKYGGLRGFGDLEWDLTLTGARHEQGGILYDMQNAGELTVSNPGRYDPTIDALFKQSEDLGFAFGLFETATHGKFNIDTWLKLSGGVFRGNHGRIESRLGEPAFNIDLVAWEVSSGGPVPPPPTQPPGQEVPEPMSVVLLASGLMGGAIRRKKLSAKN